MPSSAFSLPLRASFSVLSLIGIFTNGFGLCHIVRFFDVKKPIYLLIFIDALTSFLGSVCVFVVSFKLSSDALTCTVLHLGHYVPYLFGVCLTAEEAVLRYYVLKYSNHNKTISDKLILKIALGVILGLSLYVVISIAAHWAMGKSPSAITHICMFGDSNPVGIGRMAVPLSAAPLFAFSVVSLVFDALIVSFVRRNVFKTPSDTPSRIQTINRPRRKEDSIPVRATLCSIISFVPCWIVALLLSVVGFNVWAVTVLIVVSLVTNAVRCPMTTLMTFSYVKGKEKSHRCNLRERRRKREVEFAMKEMEERRSAQPSLSKCASACSFGVEKSQDQISCL